MLKTMAGKAIIVGSGVTGCITASLLKENCSKITSVLLLDKARGSGGRMSTSRSGSEPGCTVDLGAQYISSTPEYCAKHNKFYSELESNGVFKPLTAAIEGERDHAPGTKHFVTPNGVGSITKYYLNKSDAAVKYNHQVTKVSVSDDKWQVTSDSGHVDTCECLVLTQPVPQILELQGDIQQILSKQPDVLSLLKKVEYSCRFAMGLFYKPPATIDVPWGAKYFYDDPCIRYVAIDNKKRGAENADIGPSVVVHTSVPFGLQHLNQEKDHVCSNIVLPQLKKLLPQLPMHDSVKAHKWKYSQVYKSYDGQPGAIILNKKPMLILGGDSFTFSKFDGCVESARAVADIVNKHTGDAG